MVDELLKSDFKTEGPILEVQIGNEDESPGGLCLPAHASGTVKAGAGRRLAFTRLPTLIAKR